MPRPGKLANKIRPKTISQIQNQRLTKTSRPTNYLGISRSADAVIIQVTLNEGRTVEMKRAFYKAVADGLQAKAGLRREDVVISLVEVKKENWSFGNGEAQYAK